MLVDPNTGLPIQEGPKYNPSTVSGNAIIGGAQQMGYTQGALLEASQYMPTMGVSAAWNAGRISQTMIYGGFSNQPRGNWYNHLMPRSFGRLASTRNIDTMTGQYSPVQTISRMGNSLLNTIVERYGRNDTGRGFLRATKAIHAPEGPYGWTTKNGTGKDRIKFFTSGAIGRGTAASRLASGANAGNVLANIGTIDSGLADAFRGVSGNINTLNRSQASHLMAMSTGGSAITDMFMGYTTGARIGMTDTVKQTAQAAGRTSYLAGAGKAAEHLAGGNLSVNSAGKLIFKEAGAEGVEKVGMRAAAAGMRYAAREAGYTSAAKVALGLGGRAASIGSRAIPYIGWAMMAYDVAKIGFSLAKGAMNTAKDAMVSFKGSIDKPIMGMGYKDTAVAATSRARGVMAIQNSRLNARSVFGNEGALMAAHFG